jgi:hypothetical protein
MIANRCLYGENKHFDARHALKCVLAAASKLWAL